MSTHDSLPPFGRILAALRRWLETGVTQEEAAALIGVEPSTLSRYLSGKRKPNRTTSVALVDAIPKRFFEISRPLPEIPRVFVSSTYLDNAARRERILDAILRSGCQPIAMEHWTATGRRTVEECLEKVAQADVFVGILAWRYGWIPDGHTQSMTELEFDAAQSIERLMFLVDTRLSEVNVERDFDPGAERWTLQAKLDTFKERVRREAGTATPFDDGNLAVKVMQALHGWRERQGLRSASKGSASTAVEPPIDLEDYFAYVEQEFGYVRLAGFVTALRVPLAFDELYVPLDVARSHEVRDRQLELPGGERGGTSGKAEPSLASVVARLFLKSHGDRIAVLLGHPGAGKTTQLRRVALLCARMGPKSLGLPPDVVPLFLPLRALKEHHTCFKDLAREVLENPHLGLRPRLVDKLFEGRLLLLLDGLDEVPESRRAQVLEWVKKCVENPRYRALVSCRFLGYVGEARFDPAEVDALELRPLSNDQRSALIRNWYRAVEVAVAAREGDEPARLARAEREAQEKADTLIAKLDQRIAAHVAALAANPLLLTAICLVNRDRGHLPERRVELYDECIDGLLELWRERQKGGFRLTFKAQQARQVLGPLALFLHEEEGRTRARAEDLVPVLRLALRAARCPDEITAEAFLSTIRDESGLVTGFSGEDYGFLHLRFQEFLAARELRAQVLSKAGDAEAFREAVRVQLLVRFGVTWWNEVLASIFAEPEGKPLLGPFLAALLRDGRALQHAGLLRDLLRDVPAFDAAPFLDLLSEPLERGWVGQRVLAVEVLRANAPQALESFDREPYRRAVASSTSDSERATAREVLVALGEWSDHEWHARSSPAELVRRHGIELVTIPAGCFRMGTPRNEDGRYDWEWEPHRVEVLAFRLARTPVTNAQYAAFLEAHPKAAPPQHWTDERYNQPDQPVVGVSWDEALAFCEWAGLVLPSEAQWEYACRAGTEGPYWSGETEEDLSRVGWWEGNSEDRLHAVGQKPANPFGLLDMHGNVWEWCADCWTTDKKALRVHPAAWGQKDPAAPYRVVRGGSFTFTAGRARSGFRDCAPPAARLPSLGFRPAQVIP